MAVKPKKMLKERLLVDPSIIHFLLHGEAEKGTEGWRLYIERFFNPGCIERAWVSYRKALLKDWARNHPCTRPLLWWKHDAPKEPVKGWDHERWDSAQRRRLGGTGTPTHEVLGSWGGFSYGIPTGWIDQWSVDYYNGRAKDIHGKIIPTKYKEGHFKGKAIDPNNPPIFESEAAYLERHDFLTPTEKTYLKKYPELLEPEKIEFDEE